MPMSERPTFLPPPWSRKFFQGRALLALAVPLLLLVCNCAWAIVVRGTAIPLLPTIIATGFLFGAHGTIFSGVSSSNTATICVSTEPIRFWMSVVFLYLATMLLGFGSWVI